MKENTMRKIGHLRKMKVSGETPVQYQLLLDDFSIDLNKLLGKEVQLKYLGEIHCIECGKKTSKSYNQGFCYPCFQTLASCDMCIMKPETCHYFEGTCRQPEWGDVHCMQDHYVYLANSSGIKVGITRGSQIPTRWIDQGAASALPIFKVKNRLLSGKIEVILKNHVSDRTDWRKMLKGSPDYVDLVYKRDEIINLAKNELEMLNNDYQDGDIECLLNEKTREFSYPVTKYPEKITSFNFDKTNLVGGTLKGVKGQYLILDSGVINIRKFAGYLVEFDVVN